MSDWKQALAITMKSWEGISSSDITVAYLVHSLELAFWLRCKSLFVQNLA